MKNIANRISGIYMEKIYTRITILAFMVHIILSLVFLYLNYADLILYNMLSSIFYIIMIIFAKKRMFKTLVTLNHLEVMLFVSFSTYYLGWNYGSYLYLIAMSSLIYFCPFKNKLIPYLFGVIEAFLFIYLKFQTHDAIPYIIMNEDYQFFLYLFNCVCSFFIILYAAFLSGASTTVLRDSLVSENKMLNKVAYYDQLTGAYTRYHFLKKLNAMKVNPYGIAMFDLDDFKQINDTYGHNCGDYILNETVSMLKKNNSELFKVIRWGGEEFIILFMQPIDKDSLYNQLQILRQKVEDYEYQHNGDTIKITITIGATIADKKEEITDVIDRIDKNLYHGKHSGKNCVIQE